MDCLRIHRPIIWHPSSCTTTSIGVLTKNGEKEKINLHMCFSSILVRSLRKWPKSGTPWTTCPVLDDTTSAKSLVKVHLPGIRIVLLTLIFKTPPCIIYRLIQNLQKVICSKDVDHLAQILTLTYWIMREETNLFSLYYIPLMTGKWCLQDTTVFINNRDYFSTLDS